MRRNSWLYISILSLIMALAWVGVSAMSKMREKTVPPDLEKIAAPVDPNIDKQLFERLERKDK